MKIHQTAPGGWPMSNPVIVAATANGIVQIAVT